MNTGKIFVIASPIGNLKDLTFRAVEVLSTVDFIICEDTRVTNILLKNYDIKKELISFNARSEDRKIDSILKRVNDGETCGLLSDAGTPTISDPGVRFINQAHKEKLEVFGIPGANAAILALSISGLPTDSFLFEGFLPQKKGRQKKLKELAEEKRTIVLYESMYRIEKLLRELDEYMPNRFLTVGRELTKIFEELWRGYPNELLSTLKEKKIKGEFVVIISPIGWEVK